MYKSTDVGDFLFKDTLPTLKHNNINLVELLLSFTVTLLWGSKDSRASYISNKEGNSFMSQHSSISSVSRVFAFNKVQSLKPHRGLVEICAYRVDVSLACTILPVPHSPFVRAHQTWLHFRSRGAINGFK